MAIFLCWKFLKKHKLYRVLSLVCGWQTTLFRVAIWREQDGDSYRPRNEIFEDGSFLLQKHWGSQAKYCCSADSIQCIRTRGRSQSSNTRQCPVRTVDALNLLWKCFRYTIKPYGLVEHFKPNTYNLKHHIYF